MIVTQEQLLEKLWQEYFERRTNLINDFNSSLPWGEEDHINIYEVDDYWRKNYGWLTSSKFKQFLQCKQVYYFKYLLLLPEPFKKKWSHFSLWTAFDSLRTLTLIHWLDEWTNKFMEDYFVSTRILKDQYIEKLIALWEDQWYIKSLKVNELRDLYESKDTRERLPVNDWNKLMMMMKETERNSVALDLHSEFEHQKFFSTEFSGSKNEFDIPIKISWTLDRYKNQWKVSTIRDRKTTSRLYNLMDSYTNEKFSQILEQVIDDYGYYYQLWFYSILDRVNNPQVQEQIIYLDFVSVNDPFNSIVLKINKKKVLNIINTYIIPWLYEYEKCLLSDDRESDPICLNKNSYYLYTNRSNELVIELE